MSIHWINKRENIAGKPPEDTRVSWECYTGEVMPDGETRTTTGLSPEQIGYVDLVYTTIGRRKYIASFNMSKHPEQDELSAYFFTIKKGKEFVVENYMAWRMIGTLKDD